MPKESRRIFNMRLAQWASKCRGLGSNRRRSGRSRTRYPHGHAVPKNNPWRGGAMNNPCRAYPSTSRAWNGSSQWWWRSKTLPAAFGLDDEGVVSVDRHCQCVFPIMLNAVLECLCRGLMTNFVEFTGTLWSLYCMYVLLCKTPCFACSL